MSAKLILGLCAAAFVAAAHPAAADIELPVQSSYESSTVPLTTEKIWKVAPEELNPQRTRWLLDRHVELMGLAAVPVKDGEYSVRVTGIYSHSISYIRAPKDPTYSPIADFPCTRQPEAWFATPQGTHLAADKAAEIWDELLEREKVKLEIYLRHVRGEFPETALHSAEQALARWQDGLNDDWKARALAEAREAEWKFYEKRAQNGGICGKGPARKASSSARRWESLMEPPTGGGKPRLLARAPAKQWGGLFSILASVKVGKLELVGKFLIDSAAPHSVISPAFLQSQGALASWITLPRGVPRRITWSGGSGIATPAYVERVRIGELTLPVHDFYIHDTDFFGPPESFGTCCDGILGSDVLRLYAVQFRPGKGPEVNFFSREGFHPPAPEPWIESYFDSGTEVVSDCAATAHLKSAGPELRGVRWDTGSEDAIQFEREPPAWARRVDRWDLSCGSLGLARAMSIEPREADMEMSGLVPLDVGMALLGRGDFTLDLSHGRIWFNPQALVLPVVQNHSGLGVQFDYIEGERYLKVVSIRKGSAAESLRRAGLRPEMTIVALDSKSADEMDTWEVDQRLAGVYGPSVTVQWKTGPGKRAKSHTAKLVLPPIQP